MYFKMGYSYKVHRRIIFVFLFLIFFLLLASPVFAQEEFISVDEIDAGMKGIGKTVFSGTEVEDFDVEVIDVISGTGINHPYILVKLSGDKIDENGGISAGMSGSPVYLEGKLAGAVSHAWEMSEHNLCLITPIESMILLFDYLQNPEKSYSYFIDQQTISIILDYELKEKLLKTIPGFANIGVANVLNPNLSINFQYIQSPVLISGFRGRAYQLLEKNLLQKGIQSIQSIPRYQDSNTELKVETETNKLIPGSAVGVQLSTGDVSILTIGTATYFKDNYVLAFGHPFMHYGDVSYLFSAIYIYHSFPSIVMPFKIGSPYLLLGEVIQDRETGILAQLNFFPKIVSCKITVSDLDKDRKIHSGIKVIPQNNIIQDVVSALLVQSIDHTVNRIGQGTAVVRLDIQNALTREKITLENRFFHQDDIAIECDKDFSEVMDLIIHNYSESIELSEIRVDIAIKEQNQSAMIKEVKLIEKEYLPGETVEAEVVIKPFRKPTETKSIKIDLPDDITTGEVILIVKGGISLEVINEKTTSQNKEGYLLDGWEGIQEHIEKKVKNNQIVAELILVNEQERLDLTEQGDEQIHETELKSILDTDFIVDGYHEIYLSIVKNKENRDKGLLNE